MLRFYANGELLFSPLAPPMPETREKFVKVMKQKCSGNFSFDFGNNYPVHRPCSHIEQGAGDSTTVPKNMGWRWDFPIAGMIDKKWFPGQIHPIVRCLMKHALNPFPYDTIPLTRRDRNGRVVRAYTDRSRMPEFNPDLIQKPTLRIQKRDGEYFITMHPLKEKAKLKTDCNPYLNCTPLKLKIKDHPEEIKISRAVKLLRERGLEKKCSCVNLKCCRCTTETHKKLLAYEMKKVSKQLKMQNVLNYSDLNAESQSELDLQFTTPSAVIDERKCKPDVVHCGTQYGLKDIKGPNVKPLKEEKERSKFPQKGQAKDLPKDLPKKPK